MAHHLPHEISRKLARCCELVDSLVVKVLKESVAALPPFTLQHLLGDSMMHEIVNKLTVTEASLKPLQQWKV